MSSVEGASVIKAVTEHALGLPPGNPPSRGGFSVEEEGQHCPKKRFETDQVPCL